MCHRHISLDMQLVTSRLSFVDMHLDIELIVDTGTVHIMLITQDTQPINTTTQTHEPERNIDA